MHPAVQSRRLTGREIVIQHDQSAQRQRRRTDDAAFRGLGLVQILALAQALDNTLGLGAQLQIVLASIMAGAGILPAAAAVTPPARAGRTEK